MRTLLQAVGIGLLGIGLGLLINRFSPRPTKLQQPVHPVAESGEGTCHAAEEETRIARIEVAAATELCTACTAGFVDARPASAYREGHIVNAMHLPPMGHPDEAAMLANLRIFPLVVVYDGDQECALAERVARRLQNQGLRDVRVLTGSWQAWVAAGSPALSGACDQCAAHAHDEAP